VLLLHVAKPNSVSLPSHTIRLNRKSIIFVAAVFCAACGSPDNTLPSLTLTDSIVDVEFGSIVDVAKLRGGAVAVLDGLNKQVVAVNPKSRVVTRIGRVGAGPSEYTRPIAVWSDGDDIVVADLRRQTFTHWSADGVLLRTVQSRKRFLDMMTGANGDVYLRSLTAARTEFFPFANGKVGDDPVGSFGAIGAVQSQTSCPWCAAAVGPEGRIVVASSENGYPLTQVNAEGAEVVTFIRSGLTRARRTIDERQEMARVIGAGAGRSVDPGSFNEFWPSFRSLGFAVDARGRVWAVPKREDPDGSIVDVFAPAGGQPMTTIAVRQRLHGAKVVGDELVAFGESESGEPAVYIYKIRN
jgi:hypothetical protein